MKILWANISKKLDIGAFEEWIIRGLSCYAILYGIILGTVLLILKLVGRL